MDNQKKEQGHQTQKDFGSQPNRGQEQSQHGSPPGHQSQSPNKGQEQHNPSRKEHDRQPDKR